MSEQLNGMCTQGIRDKKLSRIEIIMMDWEVQGCCFHEVGINWDCLPRQERIYSWFQHYHGDFLATTAHNCNESLGARQQGGVAILLGVERMWMMLKGCGKDEERMRKGFRKDVERMLKGC